MDRMACIVQIPYVLHQKSYVILAHRRKEHKIVDSPHLTGGITVVTLSIGGPKKYSARCRKKKKMPLSFIIFISCDVALPLVSPPYSNSHSYAATES